MNIKLLPLLSDICFTGQHQCENGLCLDYDKVCNNVADCPNQSDELNCGGGKTLFTFSYFFTSLKFY